jgi:hypothetical protein
MAVYLRQSTHQFPADPLRRLPNRCVLRVGRGAKITAQRCPILRPCGMRSGSASGRLFAVKSVLLAHGGPKHVAYLIRARPILPLIVLVRFEGAAQSGNGPPKLSMGASSVFPAT